MTSLSLCSGGDMLGLAVSQLHDVTDQLFNQCIGFLERVGILFVCRDLSSKDLHSLVCLELGVDVVVAGCGHRREFRLEVFQLGSIPSSSSSRYASEPCRGMSSIISFKSTLEP